MILSFLPAAKEELDAAADFYESERPGLGRDFGDETQYALDRISGDPDSYPRLEEEFRTITVKRFPYSLIFIRLDELQVKIVAVAHASRRPGYWRGRLSE